MLEFVVSHIWSMIRDGAPTEEMEAAALALTVSNPNYFRAMKRGAYGTKKKICLFEGSMFPTGLLPRLQKAMAKQKIETRIAVSDLDPCPVRMMPHARMFDGIELNAEQLRALTELVKADPPRGFLDAHPGSGKTEIMLALYACFRPCLAIMIVTRAGLREQGFKRAVLRLGEEPYVLGKSKGPLPKKGLIITTHQTLKPRLYGQVRKGRIFPADPETVRVMEEDVDLLLGDEIHRGSGTGYAGCLKKIFADRRYGFSATPMTAGNVLKNMAVRSWIGERIVKVRRKKQIEEGLLPRTHVFIRNIGKNDPTMFAEMLGYHDAFRQAYMSYKPFLKQVLTDVKWLHDQGIPTLVQVDWAEPGGLLYRLLSNLLPAHEVDFIDGQVVPPAKRVPRKQAFADGKTKVLITTPWFSEGEDLPNIGAVVLACPGRSPEVMYQRAGRGFRKKDKLYLVVYFNRRHRYFMGHAKAQIKYFSQNRDLYQIYVDIPLEEVGNG